MKHPKSNGGGVGGALPCGLLLESGVGGVTAVYSLFPGVSDEAAPRNGLTPWGLHMRGRGPAMH